MNRYRMTTMLGDPPSVYAVVPRLDDTGAWCSYDDAQAEITAAEQRGREKERIRILKAAQSKLSLDELNKLVDAIRSMDE